MSEMLPPQLELFSHTHTHTFSISRIVSRSSGVCVCVCERERPWLEVQTSRQAEILDNQSSASLSHTAALSVLQRSMCVRMHVGELCVGRSQMSSQDE